MQNLFFQSMLRGCAVALLILVHASEAVANDSAARFGAGGIEFEKSEHIRLLEEVLSISTKEVHVRYRFLNESDRDIQATVAFPLPPCSWIWRKGWYQTLRTSSWTRSRSG